MRQNIYEFIQTNEDMRSYLRVQPAWYKRLMRNPHEVDVFETEAKYYFEKSIPHRVSKFFGKRSGCLNDASYVSSDECSK
ncbi:YlbE-like family protein [Peribacillus frigoritolerans]|nr:YlbE-like family protein [Peribacillus frigoritolerans]